MTKARVKICGITNLADAQAAVAAGADALGFVFYERSPRCVAVPDASRIIARLPPFVTTAGVFVNAARQTILETADACGLHTLQFHGEESPEFCLQFPSFKVIKAFRVSDESFLEDAARYDSCAWLLDTYQKGQYGGTGASFNWNWAKRAVSLGHAVVLAGGLTATNVGEAVRLVRPYAVDVSSGVEVAPGKKDPHQMRAFIQEVHRSCSD